MCCSHPKYWPCILVGLIFLIIFFCAGYGLGKSRKLTTVPVSQVTIAPIPTPTLIPDQTTDWKTYRSTNKAYLDYSLKYPPYWTFQESLMHGTNNLEASFKKSGKEIISLVISKLDLNNYKEFLGITPQARTETISGKEVFVVNNETDYFFSYYFQLPDGYMGLRLKDPSEKLTLDLMLHSFEFIY